MNKQSEMLTEADAQKMFQEDLKPFLQEREKQCGKGANVDTIALATKLMIDIRADNAILSLLHAGKLEVRLAEGKDGSDIDDYQMRAKESEEAAKQ